MNENEILDFFTNFYHILDEKIETIEISEDEIRYIIKYKESGKPCFTFNREIDRDKMLCKYKKITISDENNEILKKKYYLLELIFTTAIKLDIRTIKIYDFPINREGLTDYLNGFNKSYQRRIKTQKQNYDSGQNLQIGVFQINIVGRNHFIPRGYMNQFQCKPNLIYNYRISETEFIDNFKTNPIKIENIMYLNHFYSLNMELFLKTIEDDFFHLRNRIIQKKEITWLKTEEKFSIIKYIFAQYIRTPLERNRIEKMTIYLLKDYLSYINKEDKKNRDIYVEIKALYLRLMTEDSIFNFLFPEKKERRELFNFYLSIKWKLINSMHMKFFTSDNPIVLYNNLYKPALPKHIDKSLKIPNSAILGTIRHHGLMEPGIQLYFPLTPNLCLLIYHSQLNQQFLSPIQINEQLLIQCHENILSSKEISKYLKRFLKRNIVERKEFLDLNLDVKIQEF
jgi:uncharacterized protein DUF4238